MIRTKKRILAMLLAVVLCFSSLPFSVSADEISSEVPTESTVESHPEESPAEESKRQLRRRRRKRNRPLLEEIAGSFVCSLRLTR